MPHLRPERSPLYHLALAARTVERHLQVVHPVVVILPPRRSVVVPAHGPRQLDVVGGRYGGNLGNHLAAGLHQLEAVVGVAHLRRCSPPVAPRGFLRAWGVLIG